MTNLLLDTNVAVWLLIGDRKSVSEEAETALANEDNEISISAVSFWEIAIKRSLQKLQLADDWASALTRLDFTPMPITAQHAESVEHLPWHHRDPFDRLLVAQASLEDHALVSADSRLSAYDIDLVW